MTSFKKITKKIAVIAFLFFCFSNVALADGQIIPTPASGDLTPTSFNFRGDTVSFNADKTVELKYGTATNPFTETLGPFTILKSDQTFEKLISGLSPGTNYLLKIIDKNDGSEYLPSTPFTTPQNAQPSVTSTIETSDTEATLSITATGNTSPISVIVLYGEQATPTGQSTPISIDPDTSVPYRITGLQPSTNYFYAVRDAQDSTIFYVTQQSFSTNSSGQGYDLGNNSVATPDCVDGTDGYCLLAPIGGVSRISDSMLDDYFGMIYRILIGLIGVLAVIMIFFGGVQYMSTDALQGKQEGKERITNAVIGLIIALGSYAILNTVNPKLLNFSFGVNKVDISYTPEELDRYEPQVPISGKVCLNQNNGGYTVGQNWNDDATIRDALLTSLNATVNKNNCAKIGDSNCTSVYNLNYQNGLKKLRDACPNCELVVTGGTECWLHSANTKHGVGSTAVDLRNTGVPNLKNYIEASANRKGVLKNWGTLYVINGMEFINEGDHYHVWGWNGEHSSKYPR